MRFNQLLADVLCFAGEQARQVWPAIKARHPNMNRMLRVMRTQLGNAAQPVSDKIEAAAKTYNRQRMLKADFTAAARDPNASKRMWVASRASKPPAAEQKIKPTGKGARRQ